MKNTEKKDIGGTVENGNLNRDISKKISGNNKILGILFGLFLGTVGVLVTCIIIFWNIDTANTIGFLIAFCVVVPIISFFLGKEIGK